MGTIASQIMIVYLIVYSDADQRKHQSSTSLAFVRGIHRRPVNSLHKWPVTRKMFPFDDVIKNAWTSWNSGIAAWYTFQDKDHLSRHTIAFTWIRRSHCRTSKPAYWYSPGMGVIRPILSVPVFSQFFRTIKPTVTCMISRSYQLCRGDTWQMWTWFQVYNSFFC